MTAVTAEPTRDLSGLNETREVRVEAIRYESDGVVSVELVDPTGAALPEWEPGAHIDLVLPSGTVRQYSLCGSPDGGYRIAVLREVEGRGGSIEIHDSALVGRTLRMRGPRNHFALRPAERYLFVAGGIGVTPILSMVRSLDPSTDYRVLYGGRTRASMAFVEELRSLAGDRVSVLPQDEVGLMDLGGALAHAEHGTEVYCCGPSPLLEAIEAATQDAPNINGLHVERFSAGTLAASGAGDAAAPDDGSTGDQADGSSTGGFEVELASTGEVLEVGPEDNLMEVVREVRPEIMSSCEEGFCGTCETRVLAGEPEHNDTILTDAERATGKSMMICVGRSKSPRLVLDL